jgi:hypothetical protein
VQELFVRGVALRPGDRPGDAGELWGMLKHAMRTDGESGKPVHTSQPPRGSRAPATLRMEQVAAASLPAIELGRQATVLAPPSVQASGHPHAGSTLRIPQPAGRSGAEALGATPGVAPRPPGLASTLPIPTPAPTPAFVPGPPGGASRGFGPEPSSGERPKLRPAAARPDRASGAPPPTSGRSIAITVAVSVIGALAVVAALWLAMAHFAK